MPNFHDKELGLCVWLHACDMSNSPIIYMCRCMHATRETHQLYTIPLEDPNDTFTYLEWNS